MKRYVRRKAVCAGRKKDRAGLSSRFYEPIHGPININVEHHLRHTAFKMRVSAIFRQQWSLRHTLFIRQNCSLCTDAKEVMSKVWDRRPFEYTEIDVMAPGQTKWKNLYEFDTPVVSVMQVIEHNRSKRADKNAGTRRQSAREQPAL